MLGGDLVPIFANTFDALAPTKSELNIAKAQHVRDALENGNFDWVLHMAALTDLDWCEDHPDDAMAVNAIGTQNIANACAKCACKMAYISTSGIFSGRLGRPYTEDDQPRPANVYGRSKYEGELAVQRALNPDMRLILRVGWLFGGGERDKKFVGRMFRLMKSTPRVQAVADIWGSPNYSIDIAMLLTKMLSENICGLFHIANSGAPASRYDVAAAIRNVAGFSAEIEAVPSSQFPMRAFRPPMEAINSTRLKGAVGFEMRDWREALMEYIPRLMI